jgi:hypothetical protein
MVAMIKPGPSAGLVRHSVEASRAPKSDRDNASTIVRSAECKS